MIHEKQGELEDALAFTQKANSFPELAKPDI
jgi:hypothetical protein